jgi:hypothetical protein
MRCTSFLSFLAISAVAIGLASRPVRGSVDVKSAVLDATSGDAAKSTAAIKQLRLLGQEGLDELMAANADAIAKHTANPTEKDPNWCRISSAIDAVAEQKDAWASGLFWYTDFEEAKAAAAAQKKPILSLRLLGTLNTEFSCANSRFFRTALYANHDVAKYLKENYILHWKSVRPVPKVTIDFGDGRVVERTITGNSIHYVLDSEGNVIDGIPGLYGPAHFLRAVQLGRTAQQQWAELEPARRNEVLASWHRRNADLVLRQWSMDLAAVGAPVPAVAVNGGSAAALAAIQQPAAGPPPAIKAAPIAVGKARAEIPIVRALTPNGDQLAAATDDALWQKIADRHSAEVKLDQGSLTMIASKTAPDAKVAARVAVAKWKAEDPLVRVVRNFERSMAIDTVRNEYLFHRQIHQWLSDVKHPGVDELNERVYAELFLTPSSDPWLGLVPADQYSALENGGVKK